MNIKEIYNENKTIIWIGIIIIIMLVIGLVIYFYDDNSEKVSTQIIFKDEYDLVLFGSGIEINQKSVYQEPRDYIELGEIKNYFIAPLYPNKAHNKNSFVFILKYRDTS